MNKIPISHLVQPRAALWLPLLVVVFLLTPHPAEARPVSLELNAQNSRFDVSTGTAGLLGALAHGHEIRATKLRGTIQYDAQTLQASRVEVTVDSAALLLLDSDLDAETRAEVITNMRNTLQVERFSTIRFESTRVEPLANGVRVFGRLTLVGQTRLVAVDVELEPSAKGVLARGSFTVRQSDFGIEPFSTALGTIQVRDEIVFSFEARGTLEAVSRVGSRE